nr:hypothetical protein [uncultured Oscillibacter sp.]
MKHDLKRSYLWPALGMIALSLIFLAAGLLWDTPLGSILFGCFGAFFGPGLMQVCKYFKWTRLETADSYQRYLEQEQIELRDERKSMLRDRSGRYAWLLGMALCALSIVVFGVLGALEIVENARLVILFLGAYLIVQYGAGVYFYRRLEKKY